MGRVAVLLLLLLSSYVSIAQVAAASAGKPKDIRTQVLQLIRDGKAYYGLRQFDDAVKVFKAALKLDPNSDEASYHLRLVEEEIWEKKRNWKPLSSESIIKFVTDDPEQLESTNFYFCINGAYMVSEGLFGGSIDEVIARLEKRNASKREPASGLLRGERFQHPELKDQYGVDLLNFLIPNGYTPEKPFGLLIFMHGGGPGTKRDYSWSVISDPAEDRYSYGLRQHFTNSNFIVVAPSAPWNEKSSARWNLPEADDYIAAVIRECHHRFNIDRDRVFLGGQSMGGFGAYHLCQRLSDRIAGGVLYAGAWSSARWENMIGTPLFIRHGINDAKPPGPAGKGGRPRYTDVFYAQAASRLLREAGADHVYFEDDGGHSIKAAGESVRALVAWMEKQKRDPYASRVIAQTPRGWKAATDNPTPHSRWITIHETGDGTLPFDTVQRTGPGPRWKESAESFARQGFKLVQRNFRAAKVEATNQGDNRFTIETKNVKEFSLWLHPKMVDFSKPVRIKLNGRKLEHRVKATLLDALRSFQRRRDWGLIYHAELKLAGDIR